MTQTARKEQLLRDFEQLPPALQRRVQEYAHSLVLETPEGTPGEALLPFLGILDEESAREIDEAIQKHCEQLEPHASW
ncbi:MAG: hypothetical protein ACRD2T_01820 [Thermoanaerobaculia bacterium]